MIDNITSTSSVLQRIISTRRTVGDNLSDEEVTDLLRQEGLPSENGFAFVSYRDGFAMFSVPPQDPADWCPAKGRIAPEKEAQARAIAQKCGYALGEPADARSAVQAPGTEVHHHLEMSRQGQVIVIAHPRYLKVRLLDAWTKRPVSLLPDILEQLDALYRRGNSQ